MVVRTNRQRFARIPSSGVPDNGGSMHDAAQGSTLFRIGLVATDEVRIAGLSALLCDAAEGDRRYELIILAEPAGIEMSGLLLVLIDGNATKHIFELLANFRRQRPSVRLVVIASEKDQSFIERAIESGARGVLHHEVTERELRMAIEVVADGSVWAPRRVLSRLLDRAHGVPGTEGTVKLTRREVQVLQLLVRGLPNRAIAQKLGVEEATIKSHMGRMMRKANVTNRTALGVQALAAKWVVDADEPA